MPLPEEDNKPFITVIKAMNGYYFAAYMQWSLLSGSYAVRSSGSCRSRKRAKAENEARNWAMREKIEFR